MASSDWAALINALGSSSVLQGVTGGTTPASGGGSFVYGAASILNNPGVVGRYVDLPNFNPMLKGGRITGAIRRGPSAGGAGVAPFIFLALGGNTVTDNAYILGLSDADPSHIVLRKGQLALGIPDVPPGSSGVLARSTASVIQGTWVHLRLDVVVNTSGDVVINAYRSELTANPVITPAWVKIPGMSDYPNGLEATAFIDDAMGVNSGTLPLTSGRVGFGMQVSDVSRRAYWDHLTVDRQL
jgi:hypothetical protein